MDIRNFLFSNRSFTPVPIAIAIIYFSNPTTPYLFYGLILIIFGEFVRINAVRYAGGITRTMKVGAPALCTSGPYSRTRNPLYLGNMIIYAGITLVAGGEYMIALFLTVFIYFTFQYLMIISLEEQKLGELFGDQYATYCKNVPRLFPRPIPWIESNDQSPAAVSKTLKTEKRTLQNIFLILLLIGLKGYFKLFTI